MSKSEQPLNSNQPTDPQPHGTLVTGGAAPRSTDGQSHSSAPVAPNRSAGRYEVLRFHAKGGMGAVHVARDLEVGREVAFKEIQPQFAGDRGATQRFLLEANVTGRLEHPGIVPIYGLGVHADGRPYYAMRFIAGNSLLETIRAFHGEKTKTPGEREVAFRGLLRRFVDVCNAIAFAHDRGWLHRDIKPANVMIGSYGETLVVDWGLAREVRQKCSNITEPLAAPRADASPETTQHGEVVGTPAYMSPEQAQGLRDEVGPVSDIYSLGATLFEILTGQPSLKGTLSDVLHQARLGQAPPPRQVNATIPAALDAIVAKAMARQGEERYQTAQALANDIERWLADEPVTAYSEPFFTRVRRWARRHRALVSSLAALLVTATLALGAGLWFVNQEKEKTEEARDATESALEQVTIEKENTAKALDRSQTAEALASEQRLLALQTIRTVVRDIDREVKNVPGAKALRKSLLTRVLVDLDKVARSADTATAIDRQQVLIRIELGNIFETHELGGAVRAKEEYHKAHTLAKRLADANPGDTQAQSDLALTLSKLGDLQLESNNTDEALRYYREYHALCRRLADLAPEDRIAQRRFAVSLACLRDVLIQKGEIKDAFEHHQASHEIFEKLAVHKGDLVNLDALRDLVASLHSLAQLQAEQDHEAALATYLRALDYGKRLNRAVPNDLMFQRDLGMTLNRIGEIRLELGNPRQALEDFQAAHSIAKTMSQADATDARSQHFLFVCLTNLGDAQLKLDDFTNALRNFQDGHGIAKRLADANPTNGSGQRDLAAALDSLAQGYLAAKQPQKAADALQRALAVFKPLTTQDPHNAELVFQMTNTQNRLGEAYTALKNPKAALDIHQQAVGLLTDLLKKDPENQLCQQNLTLAMQRLGDAQLSLRNAQAARELYLTNLERRKAWAKSHPNEPTAQHGVAVALDRLAAADYALGNAEKALEEFKSSNEIFDRFVQSNAKNNSAKIEFLMSCIKLGATYSEFGNFAEAITAYEKARAIAAKLSSPQLVPEMFRDVPAQIQLCKAAERVMADPASALSLAPAARTRVLFVVASAHLRKKNAEKTFLAIDLYAKNVSDANDLYNAACFHSLAIALAESAERKDSLGKRAVELLQQAVEKGYNNGEHMRSDTDLEPVRNREDFRKLIERLSGKKN